MGQYVAQFDAWITVLPMPPRIKGACKRLVDDNVILINEDLCKADMEAAALHEGKHIQRGDLDKTDAVEEIEK